MRGCQNDLSVGAQLRYKVQVSRIGLTIGKSDQTNHDMEEDNQVIIAGEGESD